MFFISVTLFYIITYRYDVVKLSRYYTFLLIAGPWILPIITSLLALTKHYYHPVSGNWCWIQAKPKYLRYILTHGWRFVFFIIMVAMGLRIQFYYKRHLNEVEYGLELIEGLPKTEGDDSCGGTVGLLQLPNLEVYDKALIISEKKKMMLLSIYPLFYIVLWLPGIANRVAEAIGYEIEALEILQASTAYIGFVNAATFGWNEVRDQFDIYELLEVILGFILSN